MYGSHGVLEDVSLQVREGEIIGMVGPNGAGKTTALSIAAGMIACTQGSVVVVDQPAICPFPEAVARQIGFSSNRAAPLDYLTVQELFLAFGRLSGLSGHIADLRTSELISFFELADAADKFIYQCSLGMKKKVSLGCALIHGPRLLLLDEPFEGLDHAAVYRLTKLMESLVETGRGVLFASHDLTLLQRLCDRVAVMQKGQCVSVLSLDTQQTRATAAVSELELAMWNLVGFPEYKPLSWFN